VTVPVRPLPDDDPNTFPEPGRRPDEPKEPGPAPGPRDPSTVPVPDPEPHPDPEPER